MALTSMKWPFNVAVATRRRFYARDRKENGTIFGRSSRPVETKLRPLNLIKTSAAQMLRNGDGPGPPKLTAHGRTLRAIAMPQRDGSSPPRCKLQRLSVPRYP